MRKKGTKESRREARRLFGWCAAFGVLIGAIADIVVVSSFANAAQYVACDPNNPLDPGSCPQLDMVGFALNSKTEAAFTVGPVVALVAFVVCTVFVLLSVEQRRDH